MGGQAIRAPPSTGICWLSCGALVCGAHPADADIAVAVSAAAARVAAREAGEPVVGLLPGKGCVLNRKPRGSVKKAVAADVVADVIERSASAGGGSGGGGGGGVGAVHEFAAAAVDCRHRVDRRCWGRHVR
jgi:hypothetical protein